jgi:hypothetical protein
LKRRTVLKLLAVVPVAPIVAGCDASTSSSAPTSTSSTSSAAAAKSGRYSLVFDKGSYTVRQKTVSGTGRGTRKVTYHFYEARPYVANPVDTTYQSLTVSVPVEIDGKAVDATGAPIFLDINVGGYTSSAVSNSANGASGGSAPGGSGSGGAPAGGSAPGGGSGPGGGAMPSAGATSSSGSGAYGPGSSKGNGASAGQGVTVGAGGQMVDNGDLALAAGWVVVNPGCRGRDNEKDGTYFGKAPAAIVDLKAAVRYIRANQGRLPGNPDWIVVTGGSAGGALSTLLAASGGSSRYDSYLTELGAADVSDAVFASASYSPITDLDHADMAYEWMWGNLPLNGKLVDQTYSGQLKDNFAGYLESLSLQGLTGFGTLSSGNYSGYLMSAYLEPAATKYLAALTDAARATYLKENSWITWSDGRATFTWAKFLGHVGIRLKSVPAFDSFTLANAENIEFGDTTTNARHFTLYSLRHATGNSGAQLASDLPAKIELMNPMYFLAAKNPSRARNWWIRTGTLDTNTAHTVVGNLAAKAQNLGDNVNSSMYWDGGHAVNDDAPEFISWIAKLTGYAEA